jgi:hypothetical protein
MKVATKSNEINMDGSIVKRVNILHLQLTLLRKRQVDSPTVLTCSTFELLI